MTARSSSCSPSPGSKGWIAGSLLLVGLAGCSEAHRDQPGRAERAASVPAPPVLTVPQTALPAPPLAASATPTASANPLRAEDALRAEEARGTSLLQISLQGQQRMGGFALALTWDAQGFVLGQPQVAAALDGYICQPNLATPGQLRFNCVGLPGEDRGGLLASIPVSWRDRPPVAADFHVVQREVVDDRGAVMEQAHLAIQVAAPAP